MYHISIYSIVNIFPSHFFTFRQDFHELRSPSSTNTLTSVDGQLTCTLSPQTVSSRRANNMFSVIISHASKPLPRIYAAVMDAVWVDGSGASRLVDGYAEEGDSISYTFKV